MNLSRKMDHTSERDHMADYEEDIQVVGDGNAYWAVLSTTGAFRFHDHAPCVVYANLESREAAEVARHVALAQIADRFPKEGHRSSPYGTSEVPLGYFNAVGRIVAEIRKSGVESEDEIALSVRISDAMAGNVLREGEDFEIPF